MGLDYEKIEMVTICNHLKIMDIKIAAKCKLKCLLEKAETRAKSRRMSIG